MILNDFRKALAQIGDPRFRRVLWLGIALALALLFVVYAGFLAFINALAPETVELPWVGEVRWVDDLLSFGSIALMLLLSVFLMIPTASLFTGLFLEDVAAAVERRHYPGLPPPQRIGWTEVLRTTLAFLTLLIFANIAIVVLSVFFPAFAPFIFYGINGFLLGREYFQIAAMRQLGSTGAREAYRRHTGAIWLAGVLMALPLSIPILNLIIPILGAATFTHMFHRLEPVPRA